MLSVHFLSAEVYICRHVVAEALVLRREQVLVKYQEVRILAGIEDRKGSIEAGKDADFLVFDKDLLTAEHEGFSYNMPTDVYFCGKKVNG